MVAKEKKKAQDFLLLQPSMKTMNNGKQQHMNQNKRIQVWGGVLVDLAVVVCTWYRIWCPCYTHKTLKLPS